MRVDNFQRFHSNPVRRKFDRNNSNLRWKVKEMGWKGCSSNLSFRYIVVGNPCVLEQRQIQRRFPRQSLFIFSLFSSFPLFSIIIDISGSSKRKSSRSTLPRIFHPRFQREKVLLKKTGSRLRIFSREVSRYRSDE